MSQAAMMSTWFVLLFVIGCFAKPQLDGDLVEELEAITNHKRQNIPGLLIDFDVSLSPLGPRQTSSLVEGTIQIYLNGQYGTVCSDGFDDLAATVACKQYAPKLSWDPALVVGQAVGGQIYGAGTGNILMWDVQCTGTEASLNNCRHAGFYNAPYCSGLDAGVMCHYRTHVAPPPLPPTAPTVVFLEGGRIASEGRVMVQYQGIIRPVCDDQWDDRDARVVCRELNYPDGEATSDFRVSSQGEVWMDEVDCSGLETRLDQCLHNGWGVNDCDGRQEAAGVKCHTGFIVPPPPPPPTDLRVQLSGGQSPSRGKVTIIYQGAYYDLCMDSFGTNEATVVCRQLGYTSGIQLPNDYYGPMSQLFEMHLTCQGYERTLSACSISQPGSTYCASNRAATVRCDPQIHSPDDGPTMVSTGRVLLLGPSPSEGLLYVQNMGTWGTVCSNSFDDLDARVVCRELGYQSGAVVPQAPVVYGRGMGDIWMTDVRCTGSELKLEDCRHPGFGMTTGCTHDQDVGVRCR